MRFFLSTKWRTVTPPNDGHTEAKTIRTCFGSSRSLHSFEKKRWRDNPWKRGRVGSNYLIVEVRVISCPVESKPDDNSENEKLEGTAAEKFGRPVSQVERNPTLCFISSLRNGAMAWTVATVDSVSP